MKLQERCDVCDGRGFILPKLAVTKAGGSPPRTEWCEVCKRRGWKLTADGQQILRFVDAHMEDYRAGRIARWG